MRYWLSIGDGRTYGPYTLEQLHALRAQSRVNDASQLCSEGSTSWVPATTVLGGAPLGGGMTPPVSPMPVAAPSTSGGDYAGFWKRFAAAIIDGLVLFVPSFIMGFLIALSGGGKRLDSEGFGACINLLSIVMAWLYSTLMESSSYQATLGKLALGIKVETLEGARISFGRASGRHFGKICSTLLLFAGFIMAAFTQRKQALHDMMAGCLVVNK